MIRGLRAGAILVWCLLAQNALCYVRTDIALEGGILAVRMADLDGDGLKEIIVLLDRTHDEEQSRIVSIDGNAVLKVSSTRVRDRALTIYRQLESGRFQREGRPLPVREDVKAVDVADLTGDGRFDVFFLTKKGVEVLVTKPAPSTRLLIAKSNLFASAVGFFSDFRFVTQAKEEEPSYLLVPTEAGLELVNAATGESRLAPLPPSFREVTGNVLTIGDALPLFADVDGDNRNDLVYLLPWGEARVYLRKDSGSLFENAASTFVPMKGEHFSRRFCGVSDVDGDGLADLVMVRLDEGKKHRETVVVEVYRGAKEGGFEKKPGLVKPSPRLGSQESFAFGRIEDLDGDGRSEIFLLSTKVGAFQLVRAIATRRVSVSIKDRVLGFSQEKGIEERALIEGKLRVDLKHLSLHYLFSTKADLDGDGIHDLVKPDGKSKLAYSRGLSGGRFEKKPAGTLPLWKGSGLFGGLLADDLDGDGRDDLVILEESFQRDRLRMRIFVSGERGTP